MSSPTMPDPKEALERLIAALRERPKGAPGYDDQASSIEHQAADVIDALIAKQEGLEREVERLKAHIHEINTEAGKDLLSLGRRAEAAESKVELLQGQLDGCHAGQRRTIAELETVESKLSALEAMLNKFVRPDGATLLTVDGVNFGAALREALALLDRTAPVQLKESTDELASEHLRSGRECINDAAEGPAVEAAVHGNRALTEDDVRRNVKAACEEAGSVAEWSRRNGLHDEQVGLFLREKRPAEPALLKVLGLERLITYRPTKERPNAYVVIAEANRVAMMLRAGGPDTSREPLLGPPDDMAVSRILLEECADIDPKDADRLAVKITDAIRALSPVPPSQGTETVDSELAAADNNREADFAAADAEVARIMAMSDEEIMAEPGAAERAAEAGDVIARAVALHDIRTVRDTLQAAYDDHNAAPGYRNFSGSLAERLTDALAAFQSRQEEGA